MDDIEQFSRALSAIANAGAYSAKDIRQICTQEVQYEETVLWADDIPYAVVRRPTIQVPVYEHPCVEAKAPTNIQEKGCRPKNRLDSWPYRLVAFLNEVIDMILNDILEDIL